MEKTISRRQRVLSILTVLLVLLAMVVVLPDKTYAASQTSFWDGDINYIMITEDPDLSGPQLGEAKVSAVRNPQGAVTENLVIPETTGRSASGYDLRYNVTGIDSQAAKDVKTTLETVEIPKTVTAIGTQAFYQCGALTDVTFAAGSSLKTIDNLAFSESGIKSITIPEPVTLLGSTTVDDKGVFKGCKSLKTVIYAGSNSSCTFGKGTFSGSAIEAIDLPKNVTKIYDKAFFDCQNLKTITVDGANNNYSADGNVLYNKDKSTLVQYPAGLTATEFTVPGTVITVGNRAFSNSKLLQKVSIPSGTSNITGGAFSGCESLTEFNVDQGNANYTVFDDALYSKSKKELIQYPMGKTTVLKFPQEIEIIGDESLSYSKVSTATIPKKVKTIGKGAFQGCTNLTQATFETGSELTLIDDEAFKGSAITAITIPANVTKIGTSGTSAKGSFEDCSSLETVTFAAGSKLGSIGINAFRAIKITAVEIPASVTEIKTGAFHNCESLTKVTFAEGSKLKTISDDVFNNAGVEEIEIPASVSSLGEKTFAISSMAGFKSKLKKVTFGLGSQMTNFRANTFMDCKKLEYFAVSNKVTTIAMSNFGNVGSAFGDYYAYLNGGSPTFTEYRAGGPDGIQHVLVLCETAAENIKDLIKTGVKGSNRTSGETGCKTDPTPNTTIFYKGVRNAEPKSGALSCTMGKSLILKDVVKITDTVKTEAGNEAPAEVKAMMSAPVYTLTGASDPGTKIEKGKLIIAAKETAKSLTIGIEGSVDTIPVTVLAATNVDPVKVTLSKTAVTLYPGQKLTLQGKVSPSGATNTLTWKSSNSSVAKVTAKGSVTAIAKGTATVTVQTVNGLKATCKVTVKLDAPKIKAISAGAKSSKISWNKVKGAQGYQVYRGTGGKYSKIKTTKSTTLSDTNLTTGKKYYYKVKSYSKVDGKTGYSGFSKAVSVTPRPKTPSFKLKARIAGASVTYKKVSNVTGYQIYRTNKKGGKFKKITTRSSKRSAKYTSVGLKRNHTYYYKMRTYKTVKGKKVYSQFSSVKKVKTK